jgi:hypothetical protein
LSPYSQLCCNQYKHKCMTHMSITTDVNNMRNPHVAYMHLWCVTKHTTDFISSTEKHFRKYKIWRFLRCKDTCELGLWRNLVTKLSLPTWKYYPQKMRNNTQIWVTSDTAMLKSHIKAWLYSIIFQGLVEVFSANFTFISCSLFHKQCSDDWVNTQPLYSTCRKLNATI